MGKAKVKEPKEVKVKEVEKDSKPKLWLWFLAGAIVAVVAGWLVSTNSASSSPSTSTSTTSVANSQGAAEQPRPHPRSSSSRPREATTTSRSQNHELRPVEESLRWTPKTILVVLPCAGEGLFAKKTVESVSRSVPGGIAGGILEDIVVVDDGSKPPLSEEFLTAKFQKKYPLKLVRHESPVGLMGAKSAGASQAAGDVIVFFDCHVAPQEDWYQKFLDGIRDNYRRIVVPVITNLDIDTWKEVNRNQGMAKCYLTWDADFKWVESTSPYMPVLSGGLLGISRRWWNETGGYDEGMSGWGGENVDQSLRSWLCGGEIVSLSDAFVAHMWRKNEDPRTKQNYAVSGLDSIRNKARAVLAWYDEYREKAAEYPTMQYVGLLSGQSKQVEMNQDVSNFEEVKKRLHCRPFAWFLWRFRDIYVEGGLLPKEVFKLREVNSGYCLTFLGPMGTHPQGRGSATLLTCDLPLSNFRGLHGEGQKWHARNRDPATGKCCSAIGSWNTDQCLLQPSDGPKETDGMVTTLVCDVSGRQVPPWNFVSGDSSGETGRLMFGTQARHAQCLLWDKKGGEIDLGGSKGSALKALKLKLGRCKKSTWEKIEVTVPIETKLYEEALQGDPSLFKE